MNSQKALPDWKRGSRRAAVRPGQLPMVGAADVTPDLV